MNKLYNHIIMYYPEISIQTLQNNILNKIDNLPNGCWNWIGAKSGAGYAYWQDKNKRMWRVHRLMYALTRGIGMEDRDDIVIDHICNNKLCVNPMHLQMITQKENVRRNPKHDGMHIDGCYYDHEPNDDIYIYKTTKYGQYLRCRPCYNRRSRERYRIRLTNGL